MGIFVTEGNVSFPLSVFYVAPITKIIMKRNLFVFLFFCAFVLFVQAQVRFGVRAAMNTSGVSVSGKGDATHLFDKNVTGLQFGVVLESMVKDQFGIETGLLYSERGMKSQGGNKTQNSYIDLPVNLKVKFPISETVKIFLHAGPYVSARIAGDGNFDQMKDDVNKQWKARSFGTGVNFGAGLELFRFVQLGANYGLAMTDNYRASDGTYTVKDRTWSATAALFF